MSKNNNIENKNWNDYANSNASQNLEENWDVTPDIDGVAAAPNDYEINDNDDDINENDDDINDDDDDINDNDDDTNDNDNEHLH